MNEQGDTVFDRAKTVSALAAAERYAGIAPKGGRRVTACCPMHTERTPSCVFYENGTFYCFGCHAGGTSIDLVMALFHIGAADAAKKLCADFGLGDPGPSHAAQHRRQRDLQGVREASQRAASYVHAVQCGVIRWCDDRLNELDPGDNSESAEELLASLLALRQDAINLTDALRTLDGARRTDDLHALLRAIYRASVNRCRVLDGWDALYGTHYGRGADV